MSKRILPNGEEITIKHIMADGTLRDSVDGYEVPVNKKTEIIYYLLAKWTIEANKRNTEKFQ